MIGRALLLILVLGCANSFGQHTETDRSEWIIGDPAKAGFDVEALDQLTKDIKAGDTNTHAVLIEHAGTLVYEQYFEGTDERRGRRITRLMDKDSLHDLRSATKGVTSALLGIALADNLKDDDFKRAVARPIGEYLTDLEFGEKQREITLHHVLTMTSGLEWSQRGSYRDNPDNDALRLYRVRNPSQYALSRPVIHEPGTKWNYNTGCSSMLGDVILKLSGQTIDDFARERLFGPLGIRSFEWFEADIWETGNPAGGSGLRLTARDLAKIGSVYLHGGKWRGKQVVPAKWVELSTVRHSRDAGWMSGGDIWGYGYHWKVGKLPSGEDAIAAAGNGNQRVFVFPKERIAVTIFAGQYNLPFEPHSEMITKQILESRR